MGQPDIYQEQEETFDLVLIKIFGTHYEVKFVAQNFSDEETTYMQRGLKHNTREDGMTFKLGFSYKWQMYQVRWFNPGIAASRAVERRWTHQRNVADLFQVREV